MRIALLALALAACTTNNTTVGDDAPGGAPQAGLWHYSEINQVSSNCPNDVAQFEEGNFVIDQVSLASFRIVPADNTPPFPCSLGGSSFNCPDRFVETIDERPSIDAVFTIHATADGTFQSVTLGSGGQEATVDCAGSACALTGFPFPCRFSVDFVIAAGG